MEPISLATPGWGGAVLDIAKVPPVQSPAVSAQSGRDRVETLASTAIPFPPVPSQTGRISQSLLAGMPSATGEIAPAERVLKPYGMTMLPYEPPKSFDSPLADEAPPEGDATSERIAETAASKDPAPSGDGGAEPAPAPATTAAAAETARTDRA